MIFFLSQLTFTQTQNLQVIPSDNLHIDFKYQKACFDFNIDDNTLSGMYDINISIPLSDKLSKQYFL